MKTPSVTIPVLVEVRHFWNSEVCVAWDCDIIASHRFSWEGVLRPLCDAHFRCVQRVLELTNVQQAQRPQYASGAFVTQAFGFGGGESFIIVFDEVTFG